MTEREDRALTDLAACGTAACGGHVRMCGECGACDYVYHGCRHRHCPQCHAGKRARWLEARRAELLPVDYFQVVFTLPHTLGPLALANQRVVYDLLFRAAWQALQEVAAAPQYLGARLGGVLVLHTWGQKLDHHPHVHGVFPAGGVALDGRRWLSCRPGFFLPVRVLSRVFRERFLAGLRQAYVTGALTCTGAVAQLADPAAFARLLQAATATAWVVYAQPAGSGEQLLKYLARYVARAALSNERLVALTAERVTFRYKDHADAGRSKTLTLDAVEFLRRFLQHLGPKGFRRVRHVGFLANRGRSERLADVRQRLACQGFLTAMPAPRPEPAPPPAPACCPRCGGALARLADLPRLAYHARRRWLWGDDTS